MDPFLGVKNDPFWGVFVKKAKIGVLGDFWSEIGKFHVIEKLNRRFSK